MESEITLTDWHAAPGEGQGRARWGYWSEGGIRVRVGRIWEHQASWGHDDVTASSAAESLMADRRPARTQCVCMCECSGVGCSVAKGEVWRLFPANESVSECVWNLQEERCKKEQSLKSTWRLVVETESKHDGTKSLNLLAYCGYESLCMFVWRSVCVFVCVRRHRLHVSSY